MSNGTVGRSRHLGNKHRMPYGSSERADSDASFSDRCAVSRLYHEYSFCVARVNSSLAVVFVTIASSDSRRSGNADSGAHNQSIKT